MSKEEIKEFLNALSGDDYIKAKEVFPKIVKGAVETLINNKKPDVLKALNAEVEKTATNATLGIETNK